MTIVGASTDKTQTDFDFTSIYELVSEPDQYDDFMRSLLGKLNAIQHAEEPLQPKELGPHWGKASALVDKVTPWRPEKESELDKYLAAKMQAMLAVDVSGNIVSTNSAARGLYNLGRNSNINDLPLSGTDTESLEEQIGRILQSGTLNRSTGRNSPNDVGRFQNQTTKKTILFTLNTRRDSATGQDLAILMTNEIYWPQYLGPILQDLFNLTRAEVEIVRLMMNGDKVNEIAKKRSASITTVRSQLRSIFSKTDTSSQMECLRTVIGLALMHDRDDGNLVAARIQATVETAQYPREAQRHVLKLKNGRQIDYSVFGAKTGPKLKGHVLFYHDQAFGDIWFKGAVIAASRAGLQIIAPLRPGFGRTSLYDGEASDPVIFASDIKFLLDHLDVDKAAILTQRSGLVHALAAAQLMPERFTKITAANPILPVTCDADLEGTNGYNLLIPKTRLHFPQALRFLCKAGFAFVTTKGVAAFVMAVVRDSPKDLEWVKRADIMPVMITGLPIHRKHGYLGNYGDIAYADDWTPLLTGSPIPIRMVIGEHDLNVQWAAARRWASELSHAELHVLPDSGYFVQHQQPGQFLDWLKQDLNIQ